MSSICDHLIRSAQSTFNSAVQNSAGLCNYVNTHPKTILVAASVITSVARLTFFNPVSTDPDFNIGEHVDFLKNEAASLIITIIGCGILKLMQVPEGRDRQAQIQLQLRELEQRQARIQLQLQELAQRQEPIPRLEEIQGQIQALVFALVQTLAQRQTPRQMLAQLEDLAQRQAQRQAQTLEEIEDQIQELAPILEQIRELPHIPQHGAGFNSDLLGRMAGG